VTPGSRAHSPQRRNQRLDEQDSAIATPPANSEPRINDRIRAREVRLVGHDGQQIGIKPLPEALAIARELDLDLVEVAAQANPPVCRVMDYGKYKYEAAQKAKESRRKTSNVVIKEMKYRPKIGGGDFDTKTRKVEGFLKEGHKVKVTLTFRGREVAHPELGRKILEHVEEAVKDVGRVEIFPRIDGRNMTMVLAPDKRAQAAKQKADAAAAAEAAEAAEDALPQPEAVDTAPATEAAPEEITDDVPADVPETDDEASEG
jgi:translation initiation factor IF-3